MGERPDPGTGIVDQRVRRPPPSGTVTFLFTDIEGSSQVA
jgi:hypothetical protein